MLSAHLEHGLDGRHHLQHPPAAGQAIPILAGARLYGKVGPWALGLLDAQTGAAERANDLVVRVKHDLFARSYVGAIGVQRAASGGGGAERLAGLDVDLPLVVGGRNLEPSFWIMGSSTPATRGFPVAWRYGTDFPNDLFDNFVSLYRIDPGFAPTLGFVRRTGIWETTGHIDFMPKTVFSRSSRAANSGTMAPGWPGSGSGSQRRSRLDDRQLRRAGRNHRDVPRHGRDAIAGDHRREPLGQDR